MFGFDFHTYLTDMMVSTGNLRFPKTATTVEVGERELVNGHHNLLNKRISPERVAALRWNWGRKRPITCIVREKRKVLSAISYKQAHRE
jgi:hypothetical protein